jgi:hypothetical protein
MFIHTVYMWQPKFHKKFRELQNFNFFFSMCVSIHCSWPTWQAPPRGFHGFTLHIAPQLL